MIRWEVVKDKWVEGTKNDGVLWAREKSPEQNQPDFGKINMKKPRYRVRYGQASKGQGGGGDK